MDAVATARDAARARGLSDRDGGGVRVAICGAQCSGPDARPGACRSGTRTRGGTAIFSWLQLRFVDRNDGASWSVSDQRKRAQCLDWNGACEVHALADAGGREHRAGVETQQPALFECREAAVLFKL